eukprot:123162_1
MMIREENQEVTAILVLFFDDRNFLSDSADYFARNIMVDVDPTHINNIKCSKYSHLFNTTALISSNQVSCNTFSDAYYQSSKEIIDNVQNEILSILETCGSVGTFYLNNSVSGGVGSGFTALISECLHDEYPLKYQFGFEIYPFNNIQHNDSISIYNTLLSLSHTFDTKNMRVLLDN